MQLIDTHCHLDADAFAVNRAAVYEAAQASGVKEIWVPAVEVRNFHMVKICCAQFGACRPAYGIHPIYSRTAGDNDIAVLQRWLEAERPFALGEIGLDGYVPGLDWERQTKLFQAQLALARDIGLPVLLHLRRAIDPALHGLRNIYGKNSAGDCAGGVAHAFNGSQAQAEALIGMGFKLGFGGAATFSGSTRIRSLLANLPLDAIVLETDAPDMPPAWLHGERNSPTQLPRIAEELAKVRGLTTGEFAAATTANARMLLKQEQHAGRDRV